jgi:hypothetical protein
VFTLFHMCLYVMNLKFILYIISKKLNKILYENRQEGDQWYSFNIWCVNSGVSIILFLQSSEY